MLLLRVHGPDVDFEGLSLWAPPLGFLRSTLIVRPSLQEVVDTGQAGFLMRLSEGARSPVEVQKEVDS